MKPELSIIQRGVLKAVPRLGLSGGARVLDAPCGEGALTVALIDRNLAATGIDLERKAESLLGESFQRCDLEKPLPFPDGSFYAVFCVEGIEHLENQFSCIRELGRVLKPGGSLLITTPNITSIRSRVRFLGSGFFGRDSRPLNEAARHGLHHIGLLTFAELRYALVTAGFRLHFVRHTHVKPVSLLYALLAPWMCLYTRIAFRKEKDPAQRLANVEIRRAMNSFSLLFGENMLVVATKSSERQGLQQKPEMKAAKVSHA
jgi:SAM-dependent methyltransferase